MPKIPITTRLDADIVEFVLIYATTNQITQSEAYREIIAMIQSPGTYSFMTAHIKNDTYRLLQYDDVRITFLVKKGRSWAFSHAISMAEFKRNFYLLGTSFYAYSQSDILPENAVLLS